MRIHTWPPLSFILILVLTLSGCTSRPPEVASVQAAASPAPAEPIEIEFWHAMGDQLGEVIDELVGRYNLSQDKVVVKAVYQGSYDDNFNTFLSSLGTGDEPNIVQHFDVATQKMLDLNRVIPVHTLMTEAGSLQPTMFINPVRRYYSDETGMAALAFNLSVPLVYYNVDLFESLGVDPPPANWTFTDLRALCTALQQPEPEQYCLSLGSFTWSFEQMLANSGGLFFNQNNGRTGRADQTEFGSSRGVEVMTLLTDLIKSKAAPPLDNPEAIQLFVSGRAAMLIESSANLNYIEQNSSFEVGTGFMPHSPTSERNGVVIGGGALWLIDSGDEAENLAAWDFMQFMVAPEQQITWHQRTGYIPVRIDLYEDEVLEDFWAERPNFRTAFDQLLITQTSLADDTPNYAVLGGRAGTFPEIRTLIIQAASQVLEGKASSTAALDAAASEANGRLVNYNAFFQ